VVSTATALGLTVVTLLVFAGLGVWYSRGRVRGVEDLISARDSVGEGRTTATLIASVMGVWILLSAPEAGAGFGIAAVVGYAVGEGLPMLAYVALGPRIRRLIPNGHSLSEYAYARYGGAMYGFVLAVSALYMFVFLAAELTGISRALALVAAVPQWQTAVLVGGFVLLYTGYGGLRASIFTDTIQTLLVLPLLVVAMAGAVVALGGAGAVYGGVVAADPTLLDPGFVAGLRFGLALAFAILGAELINQLWWQRIYASSDGATLRRSFRTAAVANAAIVFLAALFGIVAVGHADVVTNFASPAYNADVALFLLMDAAFPEWIVLAVVLLALLLVMSSADSLFSALASLVTADLPRLMEDPTERTLLVAGRALTVVAAVLAVVVSLYARSVLRLFFLADLLGAAVAFPLVYGLYSERLSGPAALGSSLLGLAVGVSFFPLPFGGAEALRSIPVLGAALPPPDPTYLLPFGGAMVVSTVAALVAARLSDASFDLGQLSVTVRRLDEPIEAPGEEVRES